MIVTDDYIFPPVVNEIIKDSNIKFVSEGGGGGGVAFITKRG